VVFKRKFVLQNRQLSLAANRYMQGQTKFFFLIINEMKTIIYLTIILTFLNFNYSLGQSEPCNDDFPFIEVNGKSEMEVIPDEITISIRIKERFKNKEKITIRQQEDSLKYYIVKEGLEISSLSLSNANSDLIQVNWSKKSVMTESNYSYKAKDANSVAKIFQIVEKFMIYDAYISKIEHSKSEEYKNECRVKAMKNAKEKADQMLGAIGYKTGKPRIVFEDAPNILTRQEYQKMATKNVNSVVSSSSYNDFGSGTSYRYESPSRNETEADPYSLISSRQNLTFSKIKIICNVYVKFEIN